VDSTQMHQVILNLATNAAHAISNKVGLIEVKLDAPVVGDDEIQLYSPIPSGPYVRLTLTDNGCGMDAATIERIFDPFFTTKPAGKGTGLGLSVITEFLRSTASPKKALHFKFIFPRSRKLLCLSAKPSEWRRLAMANKSCSSMTKAFSFSLAP
ncbi:MAG TPA: ATP-binding protein, partial [Candidatus Acidoferrum sp.]